MQNTYLIGDVHLSASQPWRLKVGQIFIQWLENLEVEEGSNVILLGDYTDEAVNPGKVVDQLHRLVSVARKKFSHVYMLVGNHDYKLYKNKPHLSFEFVDQYDDVTVLAEPAETVYINGLKVLSLPHYNYRDDLPPMFDYYSNLPDSILNEQYDLTIGHFADTSVPLFAHSADLTKIKTKHLCLGDIHTRVSNSYIGSCFATKVSEYDKNPRRPRGLWKISTDGTNSICTHIPTPEFCVYEYVQYPEPLPEVDPNVITVYTINNVIGEQTARELYGDIFIRSTTFGTQLGSTNNTQGSDEQFFDSDPLSIFNQWLQETDVPVARPVVGMVRKMLTPAATVTEATN